MAATARNSYGAAAAKIGVSTDEYVAQRRAGRRWCSRCRTWHEENAFGLDARRGRKRICNRGPWRVG